jgi:hypothetical protein
MDAEVPYTTLEPKWQLAGDHVRTGDPASQGHTNLSS